MAQTTWLFTGTIADNLRIANPDAADDELWRALADVGLDGFVAAAPRGLDTPTGVRGLALSGGQAQRLSLARALLSRRSLLLLDEPTSQVDLESERIILDALDRLRPDRTVVLVTHRASASLTGARTLELRAGRLSEGGARVDA
nr:ABC transporter ATP-binding protein [Propioniciclava coleopterorum]